MARREHHRAVDVRVQDTWFKTDPQDEEFYNYRKGRQRIKTSSRVTSSPIRPIPDPPLKSARYVLCNGETCRGPQCTFAHSHEEMISWNTQLYQMRHQPALMSSRLHMLQLKQSMITDWQTPIQSVPVTVSRPVRSVSQIY